MQVTDVGFIDKRAFWIVVVLLMGCDHTVSGERMASDRGDRSKLELHSVETVQPQRSMPPRSVVAVSRSWVQSGETLSDILFATGLTAKQRYRASQLLQELMDVNRIPDRAAYSIGRDASDAVRSLILHLSPLEDVVLEVGAELVVSVLRKEVETSTQRAGGVIHRSLYETLVEEGHPAALATAVQAVFGRRIDLSRLAKGTPFQILYREQRVAGQTVGLDRIVGARIQHRGKTLQAFLFEADGTRYYDETGSPLDGGFLMAPVGSFRVSSHYSRRRFHPVLRRYMPHLGTDYAAPRGTPVMATAEGVVIEAKYGRYNGNYVKIQHDSVFQTQYLHMSSLADGIHTGQSVRQGQTIGYVGDTGLADGVHLCFRFWKNGRQVDPRLHRSERRHGERAGPGFERVVQRVSAQLGPWRHELAGDLAEGLASDRGVENRRPSVGTG